MTLVPVLLATLALGQLPPSPDPKPVAVHGIVVDGSDAPAAEVNVWLAEAIRADEGRQFGVELLYAPLTRPGEGAPLILVHTRTDPAGRFTVEVPAEVVARRAPPALAVWAAADGKNARVAAHRLPRIVLADDPRVRIELGTSGQVQISVLGPDGKPIDGARVIPIRAGGVLIPEPLGQSLAATTDASGRAALAGLSPEAPDAVRVEAAGFGTQDIEILPAPLMEEGRDGNESTPHPALRATFPPRGGRKTVALAPVGRIAGRLVAPANEPIRGVTLRAATQVGGYAGSGRRGSAAVSCDRQGRFEIPSIAAGMLRLELEFDPAQSPPLRGPAPKQVVIQAGRTTEIVIPLRETVNVRGLLREKGTNRPIVGAKVILNSYYGGDRFIMTDASGRFAGRILREVNQPFGWPIRVPAPYFAPADQTEIPQSMPLRGVAELEMPPIEFRRGVEVQGVVVGEDDKSVAGAEVEAIWSTTDGESQVALARTDRSGTFTLHGIDPIAELSLTAWDGFASTPAVIVRPDAAAARSMKLTISPKHTTPVGGRVVDANGRPIAGASIRLWRQGEDKSGRVNLVDPLVGGDGALALHTDAGGRYRSRRRFPAHASYYAEASAPGRLTARSPAIALARPSTSSPVLVLRRVGTIDGQVVDRLGQPVAGARIRQSGDGPMPTETLAADDGQFRLPGVLEGPASLFTEKEGYRSALVGYSVSTGSGNSLRVKVTLARTSEPPGVGYHTLPPALAIDEEKALARGLIESHAAKILEHGDDDQKYQFLREAAAIDPHSTIEWLDEARFGAPDYANQIRHPLAEAMASESLDEATTIIEAATSANTRAYGYVRLVDVTPNLSLDGKRAFLDQAIVHSKTVTPLLHRFNVLGQIADRLIGLRDVERARALLGEGQELARNIPKGDKASEHAPLYLTDALAQLDLPAALKIVEEQGRNARETEPGDRSRIFERHYGLIAHKLAARSPAVAERILLEHTSIRPTNDRQIVAVCTRMAPQDLARARRIAETRISPDASPLRPYTLGLMAQSIAVTDRAAAVRLLDEAFVELERLAEQNPEAGEPSPLTAATGLLPAVEQVAPDRLTEFLGRAVLLRRARGDQTAPDQYELARTTAVLAMMVARYDRSLAARLLQPHLDRTGPNQAIFGADLASPNLLTALALVAPRRAVERVEALPDDPAPGTDPDATKHRTRIAVAKILALHGVDRWRSIYQDFLYLWTPDEQYL